MSDILRHPYLVSGFTHAPTVRPGLQASFDAGVTWPVSDTTRNVCPDGSNSTDRLTYIGLTRDYAEKLNGAFEAAATAASVTGSFFDVFFDPSAAVGGRIVIEANKAFSIRFRAADPLQVQLAEMLGFRTALQYDAGSVGGGLYRLTATFPTPFVWCPNRAPSLVEETGSGYAVAQTRSLTGLTISSPQSERLTTRRMVFSTLSRERVYDDRWFAGASPSGLDDYRKASFEAFIAANRGERVTFIDNREFLDDRAEFVLASGSDEETSNLPAAWPYGILARADMHCTIGIGKGRRRHIEGNAGAAVTFTADWDSIDAAAGNIPGAGSTVRIVNRMLTGTLDADTLARPQVQRVQSVREYFDLTVILHVEDYDE